MTKYVLDFEKPLVDLEDRLEGLKESPSAEAPDIAGEIEYLEEQVAKLRHRIYSDLTPWNKVQVARHPERPRTLDYVQEMVTDWMALHGDRHFADDPAIVGGFGRIDGAKVMVVGQQKGRNTKENLNCNFGMPHPEGYRKALRLMKLAARFALPIVCFIDTPGAHPGIEAEERGQALAIAESLMVMSLLAVPIVCINIGEGGSGGALALGVGDEILMLENSYYSVISPEGCASILWRDDTKREEAAEALKLTAADLYGRGLIDTIIPEPLGGAHRERDLVVSKVRMALATSVARLSQVPSDKLVADRYERLRRVGEYEEQTQLRALVSIKPTSADSEPDAGPDAGEAAPQ